MKSAGNLQMLGNAALLELPKTAFLASRRVAPAAVLRCYDWVGEMRKAGRCVIGATKPQKVDMVETFNYLIGLRVQLVDRNISKGYVLVHGELPSGEEALVLWLDLGKADNAELKKILDKQGIHPREKGFVLYVNGDHNLPNTVKEDGEEKTIKVRSVEADFNRLMFEEA